MNKQPGKEREYSFFDEKFYFIKPDGERKCVAELTKERTVEFLQGCKAAHGVTLGEWLENNGISFCDKDKPDDANKLDASGNQDNGSVSASCNDIPNEILPEFDKMMGVNTPGFADFVDKYNLRGEQVAELVRRLEKRN